ncbi:hypothetical protein [Chryseobacterium sp. Leaf201]|uniref:hypothetical protein n=1 Tax=Chryseobacterium sp. Leaf201 TaxID=1735672 RepID=UPI0007133C53|nr:hypothetical protein [Chryseobacterium sp. Leaf201]KQM35783.1 hypothetical protein ASE55_15540 [Chryseobacterium sp. Leaf201]
MPHRIIIPDTHPYHQKLTDMMNSFAGRHSVQRVFLSCPQASRKHLIIIHLSDSTVPDDLPQSRWVKKAQKHSDTYVIILGSVDVNRHLKLGSLFISRHCNASSLIYKAENHELTYPGLPRQLKKFKRFREEYSRTCKILDTEIRRAENVNATAVAYHLYTSLFEHYLFHLELLCLGRYFLKETLNERFLRLEGFLPEIRTLMLKKTGTAYFIIDALLSAKEADEQEGGMHLKAEFKEAIAGTAQQLHHLAERTFREMKKAVKHPEPSKVMIKNKEASPYQPVIDLLIRHFRIEEIYLFHQEEAYTGGQKTQVLYLLLISNTISNGQLFNMMQMTQQQTEERFTIVAVAHSKSWIQEHLWESQAFFRKVMAPENAVYTADFPSVIHWHPETNLYTDIEIYCQHCTALYEKYKVLRSRAGSDSHEGLGLMLSGFFYRACAVFIYMRIRYHPNEIDIRILWKLCEYAEPKVKHLGYLIGKLPFDFFEFLNPSENLYKNAFYLDEETLCVFDELIKDFLILSNNRSEN